MPNNKTQYTAAEVKQEITSDYVLDMYERAMQETDVDKQQALLATVKVLSENIGTYLVSDTNDLAEYKRKHDKD